jgi:hypothetical protein
VSDEELTLETLSDALLELGAHVDKQVDETAELINKVAVEIYESVQTKTEANERLIAELLMGYQELTTVVQVTLHKMWGDDIEETEDFKKKLDVERKRMYEWIKNGATAMSVTEQDLSNTLEKLFSPQSGNTDGE